MGSSTQTRTYDPLDLEILDRVYEAAWERFATSPHRDRTQDEQRQEVLRQLVFTLAEGHPVDFDALLEKLDTVPAFGLQPMAAEKAA